MVLPAAVIDQGVLMFSALIIGNEILSGSVVDTNLKYMLKRCRELSIDVDEVRIVGDQIDDIVDALSQLSKKSQFVVTSGGIGPTHDDVTLAAFSKLHGAAMTENPEMKARVLQFFGSDIQPGHRFLYIVPENTELVGGAKDIWPIYKIENCFILPGLPEVFVKKFELLMTLIPKPKPHFHRQLGVAVTEGHFSEQLKEIQDQFPDVEIGSYPNFLGSWAERDSGPHLAVKLTLKATDEVRVINCFCIIESWLKEKGWLFPLG